MRLHGRDLINVLHLSSQASSRCFPLSFDEHKDASQFCYKEKILKTTKSPGIVSAKCRAIIAGRCVGERKDSAARAAAGFDDDERESKKVRPCCDVRGEAKWTTSAEKNGAALLVSMLCEHHAEMHVERLDGEEGQRSTTEIRRLLVTAESRATATGSVQLNQRARER